MASPSVWRHLLGRNVPNRQRKTYQWADVPSWKKKRIMERIEVLEREKQRSEKCQELYNITGPCPVCGTTIMFFISYPNKSNKVGDLKDDYAMCSNFGGYGVDDPYTAHRGKAVVWIPGFGEDFELWAESLSPEDGIKYVGWQKPAPTHFGYYMSSLHATEPPYETTLCGVKLSSE